MRSSQTPFRVLPSQCSGLKLYWIFAECWFGRDFIVEEIKVGKLWGIWNKKPGRQISIMAPLGLAQFRCEAGRLSRTRCMLIFSETRGPFCFQTLRRRLPKRHG